MRLTECLRVATTQRRPSDDVRSLLSVVVVVVAVCIMTLQLASIFMSLTIQSTRRLRLLDTAHSRQPHARTACSGRADILFSPARDDGKQRRVNRQRRRRRRRRRCLKCTYCTRVPGHGPRAIRVHSNICPNSAVVCSCMYYATACRCNRLPFLAMCGPTFRQVGDDDDDDIQNVVCTVCTRCDRYCSAGAPCGWCW